MSSASATHLVLIPSYNTGPKLLETVRDARTVWDPVWVVLDGSTDDAAVAVADLALADHGLRVLRLDRNQGKGAAVLHGLDAAAREGFTHALIMDADGQHLELESHKDLEIARRRLPALAALYPGTKITLWNHHTRDILAETDGY